MGTAEKDLTAALDCLEATGILQRLNRMDIEALLNPPEESSMMDDTTDEEIFQAVMDVKEDNGGHGDIDGDAADIPGPTRNEALQAALMLQRYVQDLDDPFARKLL